MNDNNPLHNSRVMIPENAINFTRGDCINAVDVDMNENYIQGLHFRSHQATGDHKFGVKNRSNSSKQELYHFGKDNCLVGISVGTS